MATINEQVVTGRKFRKLVDEATKLWQRISFWTKASDVEFNDGSTAETKMGAINGITDSLVSTSSNVAASAKALNQLNNKLAGMPEWIHDSTGKITGYKTGGADTVFPFFDTPKLTRVYKIPGRGSGFKYTFTTDYTYYLVVSVAGAHTSITLSNGEVISANGESQSVVATYSGNMAQCWILKPAKNAEITITAPGDCEIYGLL